MHPEAVALFNMAVGISSVKNNIKLDMLLFLSIAPQPYQCAGYILKENKQYDICEYMKIC